LLEPIGDICSIAVGTANSSVNKPTLQRTEDGGCIIGWCVDEGSSRNFRMRKFTQRGAAANPEVSITSDELEGRSDTLKFITLAKGEVGAYWAENQQIMIKIIDT
jgi:hypothetical protein